MKKYLADIVYYGGLLFLAAFMGALAIGVIGGIIALLIIEPNSRPFIAILGLVIIVGSSSEWLNWADNNRHKKD